VQKGGINFQEPIKLILLKNLIWFSSGRGQQRFSDWCNAHLDQFETKKARNCKGSVSKKGGEGIIRQLNRIEWTEHGHAAGFKGGACSVTSGPPHSILREYITIFGAWSQGLFPISKGPLLRTKGFGFYPPPTNDTQRVGLTSQIVPTWGKTLIFMGGPSSTGVWWGGVKCHGKSLAPPVSCHSQGPWVSNVSALGVSASVQYPRRKVIKRNHPPGE